MFLKAACSPAVVVTGKKCWASVAQPLSKAVAVASKAPQPDDVNGDPVRLHVRAYCGGAGVQIGGRGGRP
jgi:hypothetical protein